MRTLQRLKFAMPLLAAAVICGCTGTVSNNSMTSNASTINSTKSATAANTATPTPPAEAPGAFSLATPTDAYKTAYALREKKDVEGLKRVMSKDVMEFFEMMAKEENKTVDDELKQMFDRPQAKSPEVRNEKISGSTATVEYLDENGSWKTMDFVKEGSDWKMTIPKAEKSESPKR